MTQTRVTSHDVARRAGVSRTTVSLVLNRSEAVTLSEETRERVLKAAQDLGYRPNSAARMLVSGLSETIGLVISDSAILPYDGFVPQVLLGISDVSRQHGFHVLLEGLDGASGAGSYDNLVESRRIDGLIVLNPRADDATLAALIERGFPLVLVGSIHHPDEVSVNSSTRRPIAAAVEMITGLGHRRVGMVSFSPPGFVAADTRVIALREGLARHGIELADDAIAHAAFTAESGHDAARALIERRPDLTAIFTGNDTIAIGVMKAASELGLRLPQDLSIVGFDDLPLARWLTPALTTVRIDAVRQGRIAAELLIDLLAGRQPAIRQVRLGSELVVRDSCAPARA